MRKDNNNSSGSGSRPESYPRPSQTDNQLKNQPEFIEPDPDETHQTVSVVTEKKETEKEDES